LFDDLFVGSQRRARGGGLVKKLPAGRPGGLAQTQHGFQAYYAGKTRALSVERRFWNARPMRILQFSLETPRATRQRIILPPAQSIRQPAAGLA
jgi:hypothetical protein